jgi:hypothetical protein
VKNLFENIALFLVFVLSILIIFLVVQYNLVDESDDVEVVTYAKPSKDKKANYLENLENYRDVDVEVDASKEIIENRVIVKSELNRDEIENTVDDHSKSSYMQNLNEYSKKSEDEKLDTLTSENDGVGEPEKLEEDEVEDTIGNAIDALIKE